MLSFHLVACRAATTIHARSLAVAAFNGCVAVQLAGAPCTSAALRDRFGHAVVISVPGVLAEMGLSGLEYEVAVRLATTPEQSHRPSDWPAFTGDGFVEMCRNRQVYEDASSSMPEQLMQGYEDFIAMFNGTSPAVPHKVCAPRSSAGFADPFGQNATHIGKADWETHFVQALDRLVGLGLAKTTNRSGFTHYHATPLLVQKLYEASAP